MNINSIGAGTNPAHTKIKDPEGEGFAGTLTRVIQEANEDQVNAAQKMKELVVDGKGSIHDAMISISNAEGSFKLLMEMRNRIVTAVDELLRTRG